MVQEKNKCRRSATLTPAAVRVCRNLYSGVFVSLQEALKYVVAKRNGQVVVDRCVRVC